MHPPDCGGGKPQLPRDLTRRPIRTFLLHPPDHLCCRRHFRLHRLGVGLDPKLAGTLEQWAHLLAESRDLIDLTTKYQSSDRFPLTLDLVQQLGGLSALVAACVRVMPPEVDNGGIAH